MPHKTSTLWPLPPYNQTSQLHRPSRRKWKKNPPLTLPAFLRLRRRNNQNPPRHAHPSLRRYTPHFLLHHHLFYPSTDPFLGNSLDEGVPDSPNQNSPPKQPNPEDISPHRIVPDYPFLSAARYLIEANMKEAWGNLINIAQDIGGVVDEDKDGSYYEGEGEGEGEDEDTDNDGDDVSTIPKDVSSDAQYSESSSGQPTGAASPFSSTGEEVDGEEDQGLTNHEWMGGVAGYWKGGIKERCEALKARRGGPNADDAVTKGEWRPRVVYWMDYQDLLLSPILRRMRDTTSHHRFCSQELADQQATKKTSTRHPAIPSVRHG
ncbi:hypothetical protein F5887DRAFT_1079282 [Amanita rubescens]|nr:hypothetical protein F5887DRAFT_1079282 [Amanita rubescens]